ncbi:hypothetical protein K501DRAFT_313598 [Backusella circina FSU 941]|nr:hypothetical protein K501DRAFT_313598 [Backusella circina FSU 941]
MFKRLLNVWLSNLITDRLLASPLFHRMAARTHYHVSNITERGAKTGTELYKAFKENLEKEARKRANK